MKKLNHKFILITTILLALVLRFYHLSTNPPSLYWEEAALGYDAYSILRTGKDFHGHSWPLIAFESFGDFKPSLYFYALVPSIAIFGLNPLAVRFPSALFGSLTVLLTYLLARQLFSKKTLALLSAFILAISPWHLQLSRAGFEANLGLFFVVLAAWLFLKGQKQSKYLIISALTFGLSLYAYHTHRLFVPLLGLALGLIFLNQLKSKKKPVIISLISFFALALPLLTVLNSPQIKQRFQQTSALSALEPIIKSNQLIQADNNTWWAKIIHHRFWQYQDIFLTHYLDHFNLDFLFLSGDSNPRHSLQLVGGLYLFQLPLLLLGLYYLFNRPTRTSWLLLLWLLLAPVPAGFTKATPHALRALPMLIPLTIIAACGLLQTIKLKHFRWLLLAVSLAAIFEFSRYLYIYHLDYPRQHSSHWQYGYQQAIDYLVNHQSQYDQVYLTRRLGRPSIYYWFYAQTDPALVQAADAFVLKDQGEFLEYNHIKFYLPADNQYQPHSLIISSPEDKVPFDNPQKIIYNLNYEPVFEIYKN